MTYDATFSLRYTGKCPVKTADNDSALTFSRRQNGAIFSLDNETRHFRSSIGLTIIKYKILHRWFKMAPSKNVCGQKCKNKTKQGKDNDQLHQQSNFISSANGIDKCVICDDAFDDEFYILKCDNCGKSMHARTLTCPMKRASTCMNRSLAGLAAYAFTARPALSLLTNCMNSILVYAHSKAKSLCRMMLTFKVSHL